MRQDVKEFVQLRRQTVKPAADVMRVQGATANTAEAADPPHDSKAVKAVAERQVLTSFCSCLAALHSVLYTMCSEPLFEKRRKCAFFNSTHIDLSVFWGNVFL